MTALLISAALNAGGIVSMAPNITESLFFLDEDSLLMGRTEYCDYPQAAEKIDIAGSFIEMNYEKIFLINPDIVLFSGNLTSKEEEFLKEHGIRYADIRMETADEVLPALLKLDSLVGGGRHFERIDSLKDGISFSLSAGSVKAFVEMSSKPLVSANKKSYAGSLLERMGYSVFSDSNYSAYSAVSQEDVIKFNPEIIFVLHSESKVDERLGWQNVAAVKKGRVIYLTKEETDILSRPGPRISEALKILEGVREKNPL